MLAHKVGNACRCPQCNRRRRCCGGWAARCRAARCTRTPQRVRFASHCLDPCLVRRTSFCHGDEECWQRCLSLRDM